MYGLSVESAGASVVVKTNQLELATQLLLSKNISTMTQEEIFSL